MFEYNYTHNDVVAELEWTYRTFIVSNCVWFVGTSSSSCLENSVYIATPTRRLTKTT